MTAQTISLCMIVKDEEDYLRGALDSVAAIVDEIIVVDTGSTDRSPEIAEEFGARVFREPWVGDFSKSRNRALAAATGDYILILDADEKIAAVDHDRILAAVRSEEVAAFQFPQRTYMCNPATVGWRKNVEPYAEAENYPGYIEVFQVRLLPNRPELRYQGEVHELLEPACERAGLPIRRLPVPVHHYGKVRSAAYLLRKAKLYLDLGREKLRRREASGPACGSAVGSAAGLAGAALQNNIRGMYELGVQLLELRMLEESRKLFERVLETVPNDLEARNMLGVVQTKLGDLDRAVSNLKAVAAADPLFADAWNNLGVAQLEARDMQGARASLERAVSLQPDNANALANQAIVTSESGQITEALSILDKAVRINPGAGRFKLLRAVMLNQAGRTRQAGECLADLSESDLYLSPVDVLQLSSLALQLDVFTKLEPFIRSRLDMVPADRAVTMKLVSLFESSQRRDLAGLLLIRAVEVHEKFAAARNALGCLLAGEASYREALEQFRACVEEEPNNPMYIKNLALVYERMGLIKRAVESYVHLAQRDPGSAEYARSRLLSIKGRLQNQSGPDEMCKAVERSVDT